MKKLKFPSQIIIYREEEHTKKGYIDHVSYKISSKKYKLESRITDKKLAEERSILKSFSKIKILTGELSYRELKDTPWHKAIGKMDSSWAGNFVGVLVDDKYKFYLQSRAIVRLILEGIKLVGNECYGNFHVGFDEENNLYFIPDTNQELKKSLDFQTKISSGKNVKITPSNIKEGHIYYTRCNKVLHYLGKRHNNFNPRRLPTSTKNQLKYHHSKIDSPELKISSKLTHIFYEEEKDCFYSLKTLTGITSLISVESISNYNKILKKFNGELFSGTSFSDITLTFGSYKKELNYLGELQISDHWTNRNFFVGFLQVGINTYYGFSISEYNITSRGKSTSYGRTSYYKDIYCSSKIEINPLMDTVRFTLMSSSSGQASVDKNTLDILNSIKVNTKEDVDWGYEEIINVLEEKNILSNFYSPSRGVYVDNNKFAIDIGFKTSLRNG